MCGASDCELPVAVDNSQGARLAGGECLASVWVSTWNSGCSEVVLGLAADWGLGLVISHSRAPYASVSLVGQQGQSSLNLVKNQDYNVVLELDVPGSGKNVDLGKPSHPRPLSHVNSPTRTHKLTSRRFPPAGNFMVSLDLVNHDGRTAYNVSRPVSHSILVFLYPTWPS